MEYFSKTGFLSAAIGDILINHREGNKAISPHYIYYVIYSWAIDTQVRMTPSGRTACLIVGDCTMARWKWFSSLQPNQCHVVFLNWLLHMEWKHKKETKNKYAKIK